MLCCALLLAKGLTIVACRTLPNGPGLPPDDVVFSQEFRAAMPHGWHYVRMSVDTVSIWPSGKSLRLKTEGLRYCRWSPDRRNVLVGDGRTAWAIDLASAKVTGTMPSTVSAWWEKAKIGRVVTQGQRQLLVTQSREGRLPGDLTITAASDDGHRLLGRASAAAATARGTGAILVETTGAGMRRTALPARVGDLVDDDFVEANAAGGLVVGATAGPAQTRLLYRLDRRSGVRAMRLPGSGDEAWSAGPPFRIGPTLFGSAFRLSKDGNLGDEFWYELSPRGLRLRKAPQGAQRQLEIHTRRIVYEHQTQSGVFIGFRQDGREARQTLRQQKVLSAPAAQALSPKRVEAPTPEVRSAPPTPAVYAVFMPPTGKILLCDGGGGSGSGFRVLDPADGSVSPVGALPGSHWAPCPVLSRPTFSKDGRVLAFVTERETETPELAVLEFAGAQISKARFVPSPKRRPRCGIYPLPPDIRDASV